MAGFLNPDLAHDPSSPSAPAIVLSATDRGSSGCPGTTRTDRLGWAVPDYVKLQTGGYVGLVVVGLGYSWLDDVMNTSARYGFTPSGLAGRTVHAFHVAQNVRPLRASWGCATLTSYIGGGVLGTAGRDYFFTQPECYDPYDDDYYSPTGYYWTGQVGLELVWREAQGRFITRHGPYLELVTLFAYAVAWLENPETTSVSDVIGTALGYRVMF